MVFCMILGIEKIIRDREGKLGEMKIGDTAYTLPWMCVILKNGDVYLSKYAPLKTELGGTSCLKVMRDESGYSLDFSEVYRFDSYSDTIEEKVSCIVGGKSEDWFKVGNITDEFKRQNGVQIHE